MRQKWNTQEEGTGICAHPAHMMQCLRIHSSELRWAHTETTGHMWPLTLQLFEINLKFVTGGLMGQHCSGMFFQFSLSQVGTKEGSWELWPVSGVLFLQRSGCWGAGVSRGNPPQDQVCTDEEPQKCLCGAPLQSTGLAWAASVYIFLGDHLVFWSYMHEGTFAQHQIYCRDSREVFMQLSARSRRCQCGDAL